MKRFDHINATSVAEAVSLLQGEKGSAYVFAGGSDIMGALKDNLWMQSPERIVNLKTIKGLVYINTADDGLHIGALTTLTEIAESSEVRKSWPALAEAARRTASPTLRNIATIGGNICQENRCWYYRYPDKLGGRIDCVRKGGKKCLAVLGDHRFHSIFGAVNKCIAVSPSDTAPALNVLQAIVHTSKRKIAIEDFFSAAMGAGSTILDQDEIVTEIVIPHPKGGIFNAFHKIAYRKSIDFALVNCAVSLEMEGDTVKSARICLNGVYNTPWRCIEAEEMLQGKKFTPELAVEIGKKAVSTAKTLFHNVYKVPLAATIISDTLINCFGQGTKK